MTPFLLPLKRTKAPLTPPHSLITAQTGHNMLTNLITLLLTTTAVAPQLLSPMERARGGDHPRISDPTNAHIFASTKRLIGSLTHAHVTLTINVTTILENFDSACRCFAAANLTKHPRHNSFQRQCHDTTSRFYHILGTLDTGKARQDRTPLAFLGIATALTSALGLYNAFKPNSYVSAAAFEALSLKVEQHAISTEKLAAASEALNRIAQHNSRAVHNARQTIRNNAKADLCYDSLHLTLPTRDDVGDTLQAASKGQLSPRLLTPPGVRGILRNLTQSLTIDYLETPISTAKQFYQLQTRAHLTDGLLYLAVHVPFYRRNTLLDLYRYIPSPMANHLNTGYITIDTDETYIGLSPNKAFYKVLTLAELVSCQEIEDIVICPNDNVLLRREHNTCTSALYFNDLAAIPKHCAISQASEFAATQLNATDYVVFHNTERQLEITCTGFRPPPTTTISFTGPKQIHLPAGCTALSSHLLLLSEAAARFDQRIMLRENTLTPAKIFNTTNENTLTVYETEVRKQPTKITDLIEKSKEILRTWPRITTPESEISTIVAIAALAAALIVATAALILYRHRRNRKKRQLSSFLQQLDNFNPTSNSTDNPILQLLARKFNIPGDTNTLRAFVNRLDATPPSSNINLTSPV